MKHPRIVWSWQPSDPTGSIRSYLEQAREVFHHWLDEQTPAEEMVHWWTATMDRLILGLFAEEGKDLASIAIVAQGGYGRQELCYHSDIDLLFLHTEAKTKTLKGKIQKILYPLWDNGLDIGLAVRTREDCFRQMRNDLTILSSLMDTRYLAGNHELFETFQRDFWKTFKNKRFRKDFIKKKEEEFKNREAKYGTSVYLLEPNIKEGVGGLRDYHRLHWTLQAILGTKELATLITADVLNKEELMALHEAVAFLWSVRNHLHYLSGRKNDQLLLEFQEKIAHRMGFVDLEKILATEDFLRTYYRHAAYCAKISEKVVKKLTASRSKPLKLFTGTQTRKIDDSLCASEGKLSLIKQGLFSQKPEYLLRIFRTMQTERVELDQKIRDQIAENLGRIDENFQADPAMGALFRNMLSEPETLLPALQAMHETHVLERFLPEFRNLMFRAQHDVYHLYTVDTHSILAVGEIGKLLAGEYSTLYPTPTTVARDVTRKDLLAFAIFYHDIGKGEGSGHVEKGAPLIRRAGERLGFSATDVEMLEFLELSHLLMSHLAFRRDLDDPNLVLQFARSMQNEESLAYLYLLTFCDIKAVSPDALTEWKETLLEYLFLKTRAVIAKGDFTKKKIAEITAKLREEVQLLAGDSVPVDQIATFFKVMPPRYFLTAEAVAILDHIEMRQECKEHSLTAHYCTLEKEKLSEFTLYGPNSPGLFSKLCGMMAANNMNIYEAQVSETKDGNVLAILKVLTAQGAVLEDAVKWQKIIGSLHDIMTGKVRIETLVAGKLRPSFLKPKMAREWPTRVQIDNDLSPFYTVIDVYAHDRIGLLYDITRTLDALGLYVDVSKIATKVDQASDVFYVRDIFKQKIASEEKLEKIRTSLVDAIDGPKQLVEGKAS